MLDDVEREIVEPRETPTGHCHQKNSFRGWAFEDQ